MAQVPQPEADWIVLPPDESLRIAHADLAARVDAIQKDRRTRYFAAQARSGMLDGLAPHMMLASPDGHALMCNEPVPVAGRADAAL